MQNPMCCWFCKPGATLHYFEDFLSLWAQFSYQIKGFLCPQGYLMIQWTSNSQTYGDLCNTTLSKNTIKFSIFLYLKSLHWASKSKHSCAHSCGTMQIWGVILPVKDSCLQIYLQLRRWWQWPSLVQSQTPHSWQTDSENTLGSILVSEGFCLFVCVLLCIYK